MGPARSNTLGYSSGMELYYTSRIVEYFVEWAEVITGTIYIQYNMQDL